MVGSSRSLLESKIAESDGVKVWVAGRLDCLPRSGVPVDYDGYSGYLSAYFEKRLDGFERGATGGRGVLENDHSLARQIWTFYLLATTVVLGLFAHDESVIRLAESDALVQHGGRDRIRAHRQTADGIHIGNLCDEVDHHTTNERRYPVVEADPTQVDVVCGLLAAREGEVTVKNRVSFDVVDQLLSCIAHKFQPSREQ